VEATVSRKRGRVALSIGIAVASSACGAAARSDGAADSVANVPTSSEASTTATTAPVGVESTTPQTAVSAPTAHVTSPPDSQFQMAPVEFALPAEAVDDERPAGSTPAFVVDYRRWIVPNELVLSVAEENIEPGYRDQDLLMSFESNDITWRMFNAGPRDGTVVTAVANAGDVWLLVTAQAWTSEFRAGPAEAVEQIARSVRMMESQNA